MRPCILGLAALCLVPAVAACDGDAPTGGGPDTTSSSLILQPVASGLTNPTFLTSPPGDTGRLFVLEQNGYVRIVKHGTLLPTPFLDIHTLVSGGGEQGLLGFAFYPDYATSGRFIVSYTSPTGPQAGGTSVLARYVVSGNPDIATATPEKILLTFDQPYTNHNRGMIVFGPDGYFYAGFGDGRSGGDPQGHGQD